MTDVTRILSQIESGDPTAAEQLLPLVYDELRKLAAAKLAHEKPGQTLQATALVHEAYLRLVDQTTPAQWDSQRHFFAAAAEAIHRVGTHPGSYSFFLGSDCLGPELLTWDPINKTIKMWGFDSESFYETTWQIEGKKWTGKYVGTKFTEKPTKDTIILEFQGDSAIVLKSIPDGSDKATGFGRFTRVNVGQAGQPAGLQHLDDFARDFAGDWVSESVADDDIGPVKKGDKYNAYLSYKWSPDKEALFVTYSAEIGGKMFDTTKGIAGWDAVNKAVVVRWFDSLGSTGEILFTKDGERWHYDWASTDADGEEYFWKSTVMIENGIQHAHDTDRRIKGEAKPDFELIWTRKS